MATSLCGHRLPGCDIDVRAMKEIEFKFDIPPKRLPALEKELRTATATRTHLVARYFDTAAGDLGAHHVALRLRKEGRRWVQTLKAMGEAGPLVRLEHNVDLGVARAGQPPVADPARHRGTPAGDRLEAVLAKADGPLVETFCTDIRRLARRTRVGGAAIELALDTGEVYAPESAAGPRRSSPVCELELELLHGPFDGLVAAAQRWRARHGLWLSSLTKAGRGERVRALQAGRPLALAARAVPVRLDGSRAGPITGAAVQRAVLASVLAQVLPNASEVAAGNEDEEVLHQLRVGIRRTRTALRELDPLAPASLPAAAVEPALTQAFRLLGARRDRVLAAQALQPALDGAGAPAMDPSLPAREGDGASTPAAVVRAPAFQAALLALLSHCGAADAGGHADAAGAADAHAVRELLRQRLQKLHRQVVRDGRRFESLTPLLQHRVRKRAKRLRYLCEFVTPLFDEKKVARYAKRLLPVQDALGTFNDRLVACALYRERAETDPRAWFAVGWLAAQAPLQARDCRKALARLAGARCFWTDKG